MSALARSPLRMLRFPGLAVAVAGAVAVLAVVAGSAPLFLDSASSATMHGLAERTEGAVPALTLAIQSAPSEDVIQYRDDLLSDRLGPLFGEPIVTVRGDQVELANGLERTTVRIVVRSGFEDQVERLEESQAEGVWLADYTARDLGVTAGEDVVIRGVNAQTLVPVEGVYRDLLTQPDTPFWTPLSSLIYPSAGADTRPPAPILMDLERYLEIAGVVGIEDDTVSWEFLVDTDLATIDDARALQAEVAGFESDLFDPLSQLASGFSRVNYTQPLSGWLAQTDRIVAAIRGPVETLALAGGVVAVLVVAGAGVFGVRRRRVEYTLLQARGMGPIRLGVRSAVEAVLPATVGAVAGFGAALVLVDRLGPGGLLGQVAMSQAATWTVWVWGGAMLLLGVSSAAAAQGEAEVSGHRIRRVVGRLPWEPIVLMLAAAAYYELTTRGTTTVTDPDGVPQVDRLLLLFPILFLAGTAGVATRLLRLALPRLRATGTRLSHPLYLASRRLSSAPKLATSLIVAAALSVGMLVYAATLSSSLEATANQEAALFVGSEVSAVYSGPAPDLSDAPFAATRVYRVTGADLATDRDADFDVLGVEIGTFADAAFWEEEFAESSLTDLLYSIEIEVESRVPVLVAGTISLPEDPIVRISSFEVPVHVVGTVRTFPGMVGERPVLVGSAELLDLALQADGGTLLPQSDQAAVWARTSEAELLQYLGSVGTTVLRTSSAEAIRTTPRFLALRWMFGFLEALGLLAGSVVLMGALMYLQTRQRQSEGSYALARRMGLSRRSHRRSVAIEVSGLLLTAFVIGAGLAAVVGLMTYGRVDATADSVPLFRLPLATIGVTAFGLLLFASAAARLVQRRADRADVAQVMRRAD